MSRLRSVRPNHRISFVVLAPLRSRTDRRTSWAATSQRSCGRRRSGRKNHPKLLRKRNETLHLTLAR
jgi:hypothetical protein